jgi:2-keto-3-deoxy-L-rhamnonate aldolase RhmA
VLSGGAALLGTFVKSADPGVAEILGGAGFDFLTADLEHSALGLRELEGIVRAAALGGCRVIARLSPERLDDAGRAVEAGVAGIQVSNVSDAATAAAARGAVTLAPRGRLGLSLSHRAAGFGALSAADYAERVLGELLVVGQIESRAGLETLDELLVMPDGPDAWFLGPMDLSADLGHPGELAHPEVVAALNGAATAILEAQRPLGIFATDEQAARHWRSRGATLVTLGSDVGLLARQARALTRDWRG